MSYKWTSADYAALVTASAAVGIDPREVGKVFLEESGLDPGSPGPAGAKPPVGGLNQMAEGNIAISRSDWLTMTAAEQIPHIFAWWEGTAKQAGGFPQDAGTLVAMNFLPGRFVNVRALTNENAVMAAAGGPFADYYGWNITLDPDRTGAITPATCQKRLDEVAAASSKWPTFVAGLEAAGAPNPSHVPGPTPQPGPLPITVPDLRPLGIALLGGLALGGAAWWWAEERPRVVARERARGRRRGQRRWAYAA